MDAPCFVNWVNAVGGKDMTPQQKETTPHLRWRGDRRRRNVTPRTARMDVVRGIHPGTQRCTLHRRPGTIVLHSHCYRYYNLLLSSGQCFPGVTSHSAGSVRTDAAHGRHRREPIRPRALLRGNGRTRPARGYTGARHNTGIERTNSLPHGGNAAVDDSVCRYRIFPRPSQHIQGTSST